MLCNSFVSCAHGKKIDTTIEQNLFNPRHDLTQLLNLGKAIPNIAKFSKHYQFKQHSSIDIDSWNVKEIYILPSAPWYVSSSLPCSTSSSKSSLNPSNISRSSSSPSDKLYLFVCFTFICKRKYIAGYYFMYETQPTESYLHWQKFPNTKLLSWFQLIEPKHQRFM